MTRIKVFRTSTVLSGFFIAFGALISILGLLLLIRALLNGFNIKFPSGDWNSVIFTLQGILFIIMGPGNLLVRRYFIGWDDKELRFLLPDTKRLETIKIDQITSVTIRLFEIELKLNDSIRILDLNNLQFEDLKKIKEKFEGIKSLKNQ